MRSRGAAVPRASRGSSAVLLLAPCDLGGHVVEIDPGHRPCSYLGVSMPRPPCRCIGDGRLAAAGSTSTGAQRNLVERRDLAGGERLEPEMILVARDQLLEPARLAEHAPLRLEVGDRLALLGDAGV